MKNAVIYYSNTGESKRVAEYLAEKLNFTPIDITEIDASEFENAALVFPVHCQNVPRAVNDYIKRLSVKNLAIVATYGKMSCGNVIYEIAKKRRFNLVAAAYVPAKHSYVNEENFCDFFRLDAIIGKFESKTAVNIPKLRKNPFANLLKGARSRLGVKIIKTDLCIGCKTCEKTCPLQAIKCGKPNGKCIRCLKCVVNCPQRALKVKLRPVMARYLKKNKRNELILYV